VYCEFGKLEVDEDDTLEGDNRLVDAPGNESKDDLPYRSNGLL
jgi:hypothetical protein